MLKVFSNSISDDINKGLRFAQTLMKKGFEFLLSNKDISFVFYLTLVLLPAEQGGVFYKSSCKRNLVWLHGTSNGKVIFALLEDIIAFYISFTLVNVWEPSL